MVINMADGRAVGRSSSPSYTLADLERLAHEYADGSDASSNLQSSEDALKFRLYLGMFIVWLRRKEKEANDRH